MTIFCPIISDYTNYTESKNYLPDGSSTGSEILQKKKKFSRHVRSEQDFRQISPFHPTHTQIIQIKVVINETR